MMNKLFIFTILLISTICLNAADIVVTKDGNIIRGKILKYSDEELVIIIDEVNTLTFKSSEIKSVDFDNTQNSNLNSKEKINHSFGVLGITLGVPGGVNITGGFYGKTFGTRFSLGAIPQEILAFQALIEYPIYAEKKCILLSNNTIWICISIKYWEWCIYRIWF